MWNQCSLLWCGGRGLDRFGEFVGGIFADALETRWRKVFVEGARNRGIILNMAVIRISEADAARDFAGLMARVRLGAEVVIENDARAVAVVRAAVPTAPGRLLSEIIAAAESRGSSAVLDGGFTRDLEEAIKSHPEPLDLPSWD